MPNPIVLFLCLGIFIFYVFLMPTLFVIFGVYKLLVLIIAKLFRPDLSHTLRMNSTLMSMDTWDTAPTYNLITCMVVDADVSIARMRADVERVVELKRSDGSWRYPEFRMCLKYFMGYAWWAWLSEAFDLKKHVRDYDYGGEMALPANPTEGDVNKIYGKLLSVPWKKGAPMFEFLRVANFKPDPKDIQGGGAAYDPEKKYTLIITRSHHSWADGYMAMKMWFQEIPNVKELDVARPQIKRVHPVLTFLALVSIPFTLSYTLAWDLYKMSRDQVTSPWKVSRSKLTKKYHVSISESFSLERMKSIRRKQGVSFYAVSVTVMAGALRKLMADAKQKIPKNMTFATPVPMPNHPDAMMTEVGTLIMKLPLQLTDRAQCLKKIHRSANYSNKLTYVIGQIPIYKLWEIVPLFVVKAFSSFSGSLIQSTVPGPQKPMQLFGAQCVTFFGLGAPGFSGFSGLAGLASFNGKQRYAISLDHAIIPNEQVFNKLSSYILEELEILEALPAPIKSKEHELALLQQVANVLGALRTTLRRRKAVDTSK